MINIPSYFVLGIEKLLIKVLFLFQSAEILPIVVSKFCDNQTCGFIFFSFNIFSSEFWL